MNKKKTLSIVAAVILLGTFALFLFGRINYLGFLMVAIVTALFAYKIMPKMK